MVNRIINSIMKRSKNFVAFFNRFWLSDRRWYLLDKLRYSKCQGACKEMRAVSNFQECYLRLIQGLDDESVAAIRKAFARIQFVAEEGHSFVFVSKDEYERMLKGSILFFFDVMKLSETCYAYGKYLLPIKHFESSVFFSKHGIETLKNKDYFSNKDIVDVGGFIGDSAIVLRDYTNRKVYSFEPSTENHELMKQTIEMNKASNIVPVKLGLGAKDEQLFLSSQLSGSSLKRDFDKSLKGEMINITTLDSYVKEHNLNVGLIKVDIEGAEQEFLKGAVETIKKQKPTLLLSIYHSMDDYLNIKPFIESLNLGYTFRIFHPDDGSIIEETLLICELK